MSNIWLVVISSILMLPGIIGAVIPVLPSVPYMFFVSLAYCLFDKFHHLSVAEMCCLAIITAISVIVDYSSGVIGAKNGGASRTSIYIGFITSIIGLIMFPPLGGVIGLFIGVYATEMSSNKSKMTAFRSASGSLAGTLAGMLINIMLSITFIVLFLYFAWH